MRNKEASAIIKKAYSILSRIESIEDLKRHKLSHSDYLAAIDLFKELKTPGSCARTYFSNVAAFYEKLNFLVVPENGHFLIWTE